jgi:NAD(P)-dependent dehydrogenase (short-subunit alcohol dehydrogenase family)
MRERWFAPHTAYSIAKFGMSLVALGLAGELRPKGIAVNALWPRTTIATAAIRNLLGGDEVMRRLAHARHPRRRRPCDLRQVRQGFHRQLPDRRHLPGRRRRHRFRPLPGRCERAAAVRFLRA